MLYALTITIAAGLLMITLITGVVLLVRRATVAVKSGVGPVAGWSWRPSPLGLLLVLLVSLAGIALWRVFPVFLFIPFVVPFFWRWRGRSRAAFTFVRRRGHRPPSNGHSAGNGHAIEGSYRPLDDE